MTTFRISLTVVGEKENAKAGTCTSISVFALSNESKEAVIGLTVGDSTYKAEFSYKCDHMRVH